MIDFENCRFCNDSPKVEVDIDASRARLSCNCGIMTKWVPTEIYDRERFDKEGPESEYGGAYYSQPWEETLRGIWHRKPAADPTG